MATIIKKNPIKRLWNKIFKGNKGLAKKWKDQVLPEATPINLKYNKDKQKITEFIEMLDTRDLLVDFIEGHLHDHNKSLPENKLNIGRYKTSYNEKNLLEKNPDLFNIFFEINFGKLTIENLQKQYDEITTKYAIHTMPQTQTSQLNPKHLEEKNLNLTNADSIAPLHDNVTLPSQYQSDSGIDSASSTPSTPTSLLLKNKNFLEDDYSNPVDKKYMYKKSPKIGGQEKFNNNIKTVSNEPVYTKVLPKYLRRTGAPMTRTDGTNIAPKPPITSSSLKLNSTSGPTR